MSYWTWAPLLPGGAALASGGTATESATDSCAVGATEALSLLSTLSVSDGCAVQAATESSSIASTISAAETCAGQLSDVPQAPIVVVNPVDTCAAQIAESTPLLVQGFFAIDACVFQIYSELTTFGDRTLFYGDSLATQAVEQWRTVVGTEVAGTGVGFTHWEVAEPLPVQASDVGWPGNTIVVIGLQDATPAVFVMAGATDNAAVQGNELTSAFVAVSTSDSCVTQATETLPLIVAVIATTDGCVVQASDGSPSVVQSAVLSATDACGVGATEPVPLIGQAATVTDACALQAPESIAGPHAVVVDEAIVVGAAEPLPGSALITSINDAAALLIDDQSLVVVAPIVTDTNVVQVTEASAQQVVGTATPITASDSCAMPIEDEIEPVLALYTSDDCALPIEERVFYPSVPAEEVALMLLEQVSLEITRLEVIYSGGSHFEEAGRYLYTGSYRMGPRNADETRGDLY